MREMRALLALDSESGEVGTKAIEIEMVKDGDVETWETYGGKNE